MKDIKSLTGHVAALTKFISKATDWCAPFFNGNKHNIVWTPKCYKAFTELKNYMSKEALLSKPEYGEALMIYLSIFSNAGSTLIFHYS
ncbi:unnamed protein product [Prunus armeniaca]